MSPQRRVSDHWSWTAGGFVLILAAIGLAAFKVWTEWPSIALAALGGVLIKGESVISLARVIRRQPPEPPPAP